MHNDTLTFLSLENIEITEKSENLLQELFLHMRLEILNIGKNKITNECSGAICRSLI
jgi:hypothetical protein